MSQENARIVERALRLLAESYRIGEPAPGLIDICSPEIRIDASRRVFNPDIYDGHDGLRRVIREILEAWEGFTETTERMIDLGERIAVLQTISGRGRASGADVKSDGAVVWTLHDGLAVRVEVFLDHQEALAAAGVAG